MTKKWVNRYDPYKLNEADESKMEYRQYLDCLYETRGKLTGALNELNDSVARTLNKKAAKHVTEAICQIDLVIQDVRGKAQ